MKNVRVNKIGEKLLEIEPTRFFGGIHDCIEALPDIQERENIKFVFRVDNRLYLVLE